jgi:hypothetical protein
MIFVNAFFENLEFNLNISLFIKINVIFYLQCYTFIFLLLISYIQLYISIFLLFLFINLDFIDFHHHWKVKRGLLIFIINYFLTYFWLLVAIFLSYTITLYLNSHIFIYFHGFICVMSIHFNFLISHFCLILNFFNL